MAFVVFTNQLGLSLSMHAGAYSSTDIGMAVAVGALVSIPLIYLLGWLSDKYPRRLLLIACFLSAGAGTLVLAVAGQLWQFWLAAMFIAVLTASDSLSNALATDLAPKELVGRGLSLTNSARWLGAVVGFGLAGYLIDLVGIRSALLLIFILVPVAVLMTTQIRHEAVLAREQAKPVG